MARTSKYLLPAAELESLRGWAKLESQQQNTVEREAKALSEALYAEGKSRLSIGQHLFTISGILAPLRLFDAFLKKHFHMSKSTAFNYINLYKAAVKDAPKNVLDIAMSRNYKVVNRPQVFKTYPPPKTNDTSKIIQYLDRLETRKPKVVTIHKNLDGLVKQALHAVGVCYKQVPNNQKPTFARNLIGMELTSFGFNSEQSFAPMEIPESYVVHRGRPKEKQAA